MSIAVFWDAKWCIRGYVAANSLKSRSPSVCNFSTLLLLPLPDSNHLPFLKRFKSQMFHQGDKTIFVYIHNKTKYLIFIFSSRTSYFLLLFSNILTLLYLEGFIIHHYFVSLFCNMVMTQTYTELSQYSFTYTTPLYLLISSAESKL